MNALFEHPLVVRLGWTLLHFLWQGAAVAVVLAVLLQLARTAKPAIRYALACSALFAMALCPLVTFSLTAPPAARGNAAPPSGLAGSQGSIASAEGLPSGTETLDPSPASPSAPSVAAQPEGSLAPVAEGPRSMWQPAFVAVWLAGVVTLSIWHCLGLIRLRILRQSAEPISEPQLLQVLTRLKGQLRIRGAVELLATARLQVPAVIGVLRPAILFPVSALTGLSSQQLTAVLAHELAHVRRFDFLVRKPDSFAIRSEIGDREGLCRRGGFHLRDQEPARSR